jgi:hypothetical protein
MQLQGCQLTNWWQMQTMKGGNENESMFEKSPVGEPDAHGAPGCSPLWRQIGDAHDLAEFSKQGPLSVWRGQDGITLPIAISRTSDRGLGDVSDMIACINNNPDDIRSSCHPITGYWRRVTQLRPVGERNGRDSNVSQL